MGPLILENSESGVPALRGYMHWVVPSGGQITHKAWGDEQPFQGQQGHAGLGKRVPNADLAERHLAGAVAVVVFKLQRDFSE